MTLTLADFCKRETAEAFGAWAESLWAGMFSAAGMRYVPLHKIQDGGAPMEKGEDGFTVLPDYEVRHPEAIRFYVDSKAKRSPVYYHVAGGESRHGIDRWNWNQYLEISGANRQHCFLAIFEAFTSDKKVEWSGTMLIQSLVKLGEPFFGHSTGAHMVYWPRHRFAQVGALAYNTTITKALLASFKPSLLKSIGVEIKKPVQASLFG